MITAGKSKNSKTKSKTPNKKINNKNVTVGLIHANWCGHCQHLMPEWNKMEHNIKNNPKLSANCEIVKIESEHLKNELPKYENMINEKISVDGYPTIFLIKNNKIEKYSGDRSSEALGGWVAGAVNGYTGGKKHVKTRKSSKKKCKSCKSVNIFKLW